jgi:hypothetical protein
MTPSIDPQPMTVPDLLKRFVPTPLKQQFRLGSIEVAVETNDPAIASTVRAGEAGPQATGPSFLWKLVRDGDVRDELCEPMVIEGDRVAALSMGPACLIAVDYNSRELVGFLGVAIDDRTFTGRILPLLRRLTQGRASCELGRSAASSDGQPNA